MLIGRLAVFQNWFKYYRSQACAVDDDSAWVGGNGTDADKYENNTCILRQFGVNRSAVDADDGHLAMGASTGGDPTGKGGTLYHFSRAI